MHLSCCCPLWAAVYGKAKTTVAKLAALFAEGECSVLRGRCGKGLPYRESVLIEASSKEPIYDHGLMKPYVFFDVSAGRETRQGSGSLRNQVSLCSPWILCFSSPKKYCRVVSQAGLVT